MDPITCVGASLRLSPVRNPYYLHATICRGITLYLRSVLDAAYTITLQGSMPPPLNKRPREHATGEFEAHSTSGLEKFVVQSPAHA